MPAKPTLADFFRLRFAARQSPAAKRHHALKGGHERKKIVTACLTARHRHHWASSAATTAIGGAAFGALRRRGNLLGDPRAIRAVRFYADESVGYGLSRSIREAVRCGLQAGSPISKRRIRKRARINGNMTARLITLNDIYSLSTSTTPR